MSQKQTSTDSRNAISSAEFPAGPLPCGSLTGPPTGLFGQAVVLASRSAVPEKEKASTTSDTSGLSSPVSLASASLQQSLASRLQARLDVDGSMEYSLTWKTWTTDAGRQICALRARARPISDSDCFGWPTARAMDGDMIRETAEQKITRVRRIAAAGKTPPGFPGNLVVAANCLAGWVTTSTRDHKDTLGMSATGTNPDGSTRLRMDQLGRQAGTASTSSDALNQLKTPDGTWKKGVGLNPAFVCWLQGFPAEWLSCVDWETPSSPK